VPTNCMRACTAVVTELSWIDSNDENAKYRALIEFIKPEDWEKELSILFKDLLDGSGKVSKEATNPDSEAGVVYAKIKAGLLHSSRDDFPDPNKSSVPKYDQRGYREQLCQTVDAVRCYQECAWDD